MLLLAGILIVLAFILLSIQTSRFATLGQQAGRELDRPLVDDYLLLRRSLEIYLKDELRDSASTIDCPADLVEYRDRITGFLELMVQFEQDRGQHFRFVVDSVTQPTATTVEVQVRVYFADDISYLADDLTYDFGCNP